MKKVSLLIDSEKMVSMTQKHLIEEGRLKYSEFTQQICKIMVRIQCEYIFKWLFYFKQLLIE